MRKQQQSNNPNGSGNYSPIGLSSMPMSYHTGGGGGISGGGGAGGGPGIGTAAIVTSNGPNVSPNTYVLPNQSLTEVTYAASPQSKFTFP